MCSVLQSPCFCPNSFSTCVSPSLFKHFHGISPQQRSRYSFLLMVILTDGFKQVISSPSIQDLIDPQPALSNHSPLFQCWTQIKTPLPTEQISRLFIIPFQINLLLTISASRSCCLHQSFPIISCIMARVFLYRYDLWEVYNCLLRRLLS